MKHYEKRILKKMGLKPSKKVFENLNPKEVDVYNKHRQEELGKKEYEYFEITEPGSSEKDIFSYENIRDWDEENFHFQEESRKKGNR